MRPAVDTRWGSMHNGVREQKQPTYNHVRANLKRAQIQDERFAEIELENTVLLAKLSKILRRSRNPTVGTRDWSGGLRLTPNQVPVIDHWISADTTAFGAAVEPSSLNLAARRRERERIEVENRALVARLHRMYVDFLYARWAPQTVHRLHTTQQAVRFADAVLGAQASDFLLQRRRRSRGVLVRHGAVLDALGALGELEGREGLREVPIQRRGAHDHAGLRVPSE